MPNHYTGSGARHGTITTPNDSDYRNTTSVAVPFQELADNDADHEVRIVSHTGSFASMGVQLAGKANLSGATFTGAISAPSLASPSYNFDTAKSIIRTPVLTPEYLPASWEYYGNASFRQTTTPYPPESILFAATAQAGMTLNSAVLYLDGNGGGSNHTILPTVPSFSLGIVNAITGGTEGVNVADPSISLSQYEQRHTITISPGFALAHGDMLTFSVTGESGAGAIANALVIYGVVLTFTSTAIPGGLLT